MNEHIDQDTIKKFAWHLKVLGAYVQAPKVGIVGLDRTSIIASNDAAALYPTSIIYSNIGFDTLRHRVYDGNLVRSLVGLLQNVFDNRSKNPTAVKSALSGFTSALDQILKEYYKSRKNVPGKKDAREFTLEYYPYLLKKLLVYPGELKDIFEPKTDETYYLLKSCLHPLLETITWLSPQNRGYSQVLVDYVFFNDSFIEKPIEFYVLQEVNSTKSQFKILDFKEGLDLLSKYVINPYGILFDKHKDNLAYDVELLQEALSKRRIIKNQMLVLGSLGKHFDKLSKDSEQYLYTLSGDCLLTESQAEDILTDINDSENRAKRIKALTGVEFKFRETGIPIQKFIKLRISQLNIVQLGIKVAANSAYGIFGLITWPFASPLIGNAITNAGKIYGIKLFQAVTVDTLNNNEIKIQGERDVK